MTSVASSPLPAVAVSGSMGMDALRVGVLGVGALGWVGMGVGGRMGEGGRSFSTAFFARYSNRVLSLKSSCHVYVYAYVYVMHMHMHMHMHMYIVCSR